MFLAFGSQGEVKSNAGKIAALIWTFFSLATTFLSIRIYARTRILGVRGLWWDDGLLIATWMFILTQTILSQHGCNLGFGKNVSDLGLVTLSDIGFFFIVSAGVNICASLLSKVAFGLTVLRFATGIVWMRRLIVTLIIATAAFKGVMLFLPYTRCKPAEKSWKVWLDGECSSRDLEKNWGAFSAAWGGFVDIVFSLLPWKLLPLLKISRREKVGLGIAMSMGVCAGISSFVKASYARDFLNYDFSYNGFWLVFWGIAEPPISLMAVCVPMLRVLLRDSRRNLTTIVRSRRHHGGFSSPPNSQSEEQDEDQKSQETKSSTQDVVKDNSNQPHADKEPEEEESSGDGKGIPMERVKSQEMIIGRPVTAADLV
ncbi:uncharacterized protein MKZ38_006302 [Zalerion maritima]|uniref:Rhodopsin domain-containing protein n=1 Tax=Zalerion maritima TaxID=339359 RepID=A0AAD5RJZ8_9PEZI|nr:uncharacterized protein MKZ38_006302 [Zalerion maritima]